MPAAKPLPLEELAAAQGSLTPDEVARRYQALTGYKLTEKVPPPLALRLLGGTDRPAKDRAKLMRYFELASGGGPSGRGAAIY